MNRIAAVVVTYNNNEMLRCLMEDIMAQTRLPDEIIVVDNGDDGYAGRMINEKFSRVKSATWKDFSARSRRKIKNIQSGSRCFWRDVA